MQTYDYSETLAYYLTNSSREINMGPIMRQYKLDQNQPEYYFFTKMPESTLNIAVCYCYCSGELTLLSITPTNISSKFSCINTIRRVPNNLLRLKRLLFYSFISKIHQIKL